MRRLLMPASSKVKFKNKSKDKTKFVCDFCGEAHDELWEAADRDWETV